MYTMFEDVHLVSR